MTPLVQAKTTNRLERPALPRSKGLGPRAAEIRGAYIPGLKTSGFVGVVSGFAKYGQHFSKPFPGEKRILYPRELQLTAARSDVFLRNSPFIWQEAKPV